MTKSELRNLALLLRSRVVEVFDAISPAYGEAASWSLNLSDAALPTVEQVKAVFLAYEALKKPPLALYDELRELRNAETTTPLPALSLSVAWEAVTGKPATFAPSEHTHEAQAVAWEAVTGKPATFTPSEHTHEAQAVAWEAVTGKPATFTPCMTEVNFIGNLAASRTLAFTGDFVAQYMILIGYGTAVHARRKDSGFTSALNTITISATDLVNANYNGHTIRLLLWG